MKKFSLLLLALSAATSFHAGAQGFKPAGRAEQLLQELRKSSQATTSIQASFSEEKYMAVLKDPERSSGVFYYQKKDKMRWEQKSPAKYVILINSDKFRIREAGKEKSAGPAGRLAPQIRDLMIGLVNGDFQENKAFTQQVLETDSQFRVVLTPVARRLKNRYANISLTFNKSSFRLKELTFKEKDGDKSVMKFQNEKYNLPLDDSLFQNL